MLSPSERMRLHSEPICTFNRGNSAFLNLAVNDMAPFIGSILTDNIISKICPKQLPFQPPDLLRGFRGKFLNNNVPLWTFNYDELKVFCILLNFT